MSFPLFGECFFNAEEVVIADLTRASIRAQKQTPAASRLNTGNASMLKVLCLHLVCWYWLQHKCLHFACWYWLEHQYCDSQTQGGTSTIT